MNLFGSLIVILTNEAVNYTDTHECIWENEGNVENKSLWSPECFITVQYTASAASFALWYSDNVAKNNKTHFLYVIILYSDKTGTYLHLYYNYW